MDCRQGGTAIEGMGVDDGNALGDDDFFKRGAFAEGTFPDGDQIARFGDGYGFQIFTTCKGLISDMLGLGVDGTVADRFVGNGDQPGIGGISLQVEGTLIESKNGGITVCEAMLADLDDLALALKCCQSGTAAECFVGNGRDRCGKLEGLECGAIFECACSQLGDVIGDNQRGCRSVGHARDRAGGCGGDEGEARKGIVGFPSRLEGNVPLGELKGIGGALADQLPVLIPALQGISEERGDRLDGYRMSGREGSGARQGAEGGVLVGKVEGIKRRSLGEGLGLLDIFVGGILFYGGKGLGLGFGILQTKLGENIRK